jgi:hypothetical protein
MPGKKSDSPHTIHVSPEIHRRACEFLADGLICDAEKIARRGDEVNKARAFHGLPANPTMDVHQVAAAMALSIAKDLISGRLVAGPSKGTK